MINVVDGVCGSYKTTRMFEYMLSNPDKRYLYITPFLSEIEERIPEKYPSLEFHCPVNKGKGKLSNLAELVDQGVNISSTHVLFGMFTPEIVDNIIEKGYCLVIDEVVDCVGLLPNDFKPKDTEALLTGDFVFINKEERGKLYWNEEKYPNHDGKYEDIRLLCHLEMLYSYEDEFLMWEYPPKLLKNLDDVFVLTYLFNGSDMRCWLQLNDIPYQYVDKKEWGIKEDKEIIEKVRENLTFIENRNLNSIRQTKTALSVGWFDNADASVVRKYRGIMRSAVVQYKPKNVFWTTFKDQAPRLAGAGYSKGVKNKTDKPSFLPCNIRATNDYVDYDMCMYAMNKFKNPVEVNYMRSNGVQVDEDSYALSEMIQFIFRGSIRANKPMKLLVLSKRMRGLLEGWLNEE